MSRSKKLLRCLGEKKANFRGKIKCDSEMQRFNWFRTCGIADVLFEPIDEEDLSFFLSCVPQNIPVTVIGLGSNLLIREGGISGCVVRLPIKGFGGIRIISESFFEVGAACPARHLSLFALEKEIEGFHFYYGIPGSVGGALRMNAGANGFETSDHVFEIRAVDRRGQIHILNRESMGYNYRKSSASGDLIFLSAVFKLQKGDKENIHNALKNCKRHREEVQPIREKTGGSTFKNPSGTSAWKEIDKAGCRGLTLGGAQISSLHCNFMINTGSATAYDLELLGETVRSRVFQSSGIDLEWEIQRVGLFKDNRVVHKFYSAVD